MLEPRYRFFAILVGAALSVACQGKLAPSVAMAGTTIAIPLDGWVSDGFFRTNPLVIGFGGEPGFGPEDHQRGYMEYTLDNGESMGTTQYVLHTRFTSRFLPDATAPVSESANSQLASLVDIPASVPADHYTILVRRILPSGSPDPTNYEYNGELEVVAEDPLVSGFTPIEGWNKWTMAWFPSSPIGAIPSPELRIDIDTSVHALEISVDIPSKVTPLRVFSRDLVGASTAPVAWYANSSGTVKLSAFANGAPFDSLALGFNLGTGEQPALFGDFSNLTVVAAYDQDGLPISNIQILPSSGVY